MAEERTEKRLALTIQWRIENISRWETKFLCIDSCKVRSSPNSFWQLRILPWDLHEHQHQRLGIQHYGTPFTYPIDIECSILDSNGSPLFIKTLRDQFIEKVPFVAKTEDLPTISLPLMNDILLVRCRIWKPKEEFEQVQHFSLLNRIEMRSASILWPIECFSSLQLEQKVTTSLFMQYYSRYSSRIPLTCSLTGPSLQDSRLGFEIDTPKEVFSFLNFKVSVLDGFKEVLKSAECQDTFFTPLLPNDDTTALSRQELLNEKCSWLDSDVLTLKCNFVYIFYEKFTISYDCGPFRLFKETDMFHSTTVNSQTSEQNGHSAEIRKIHLLDVLRKDFLSMYQDRTLSDIELRTSDVSFPVHKNILSARSPVFKAKLSNDIKEPENDVLNVLDVDASTLNRLLTFMYTGTIKKLHWEEAIKLYDAAHKYQVSYLKQMCGSTLKSLITTSNVCDILVLADKYQDQQVTSIAHDFILSDFDEVMQSTEWAGFMDEDPVLAAKEIHQILKKKYELSQKKHRNPKSSLC